MFSRTFTSIVIALATGVLSACGGGSDSPPPPPPATQTAVGTITGFGSVVVNGIKFDDSAASVSIDDATLTRDRLRIGMVVQVRGRINADGTGVAQTIRYTDCMEGPITAMNQVQNTVTLMGQTVQVDDATVFDGVTLRDMNAFAIGDLVEVSCLPDPANNRVRATRMERKGTFQNGVSDIEVKGVVSNLNLNNGTCTIGGLSVNFAGVAAANRPAGLANGMTVEAGGRNFANGLLTADRLRDRDRDRISYPNGDGLEVEGYVSEFVSIANFKVDGQVVNASNAVIKNGVAADIANGVKVEAEGTITNNVLVASVLVIKLQTNVRVEAGMQAKAASTITLLGRTIQVNASTEFIDRLANQNQPATITLAALNVGDRLEVKAYRDANANLVATRVERTEADALVVVKGPAEAKTPTTQLTLAGIGVSTSATTLYRNADRALVDAASFYALVQVPPAVPTMVHARGVVADLATNVVDATRTTSIYGELEIGED
jgi:Domain of unknown function (DUF5666)